MMQTGGMDRSWVVVLAGVSAATHIAKLPPALPALQQSFGLSLVQAGFLLSMVQLASLALGLVAGLWADAMGLRRSMLAGLGVLMGCSVLGGWAESASMLLLLRALEGLGYLLTVMPAPSLIRRMAPVERLHRRMGLWSAFMPMGTALALLVGPLLIAQTDWRVWWWALALVSACMMAAVLRWVPSDPQGPSWQVAGGAGLGTRLGLTLRNAGGWLIALCFAVYAAQWLAMIGFLPTIYQALGVATTWTAVMTAMVAGVNIIGNLLAGRWLQAGWPVQRVLSIGFGGMILGACMACMRIDGAMLPVPLQFLGVLMLSALGGLIPGALFAMVLHLAPSEDTVATTVGMLQQWSAIGQFFGPPLVAWVAAQVGGWHWTWAVLGCLSLLGLMLAQQIARVLARREAIRVG